MREHASLEQEVRDALADPKHDRDPLHAVLGRLWEAHHDLLGRLERIARVSDGYQSIVRQREQSLAARFEKELRRIEKVSRISDRYQNMMRDLNIALREASTHDALTGIANRRLLTERLREESERSKRYARPLSIAMLDIDHFKAINDQYGHEIGDCVLIEVVQVMEAEVRDHDLCGRWGGEEFLVLMPETSLAMAERVTERLRRSIASLAVRAGKELLSVTVSVGVAELRADENYSSAINRADVALLLAKRNGRNCCETAS